VAPDNGVLSLVEAREQRFTVRHITAEFRPMGCMVSSRA
jgi:S-adenosylmethionine hydrolase